MAKRFDVKRLSPEERIELAEELWDSLVEEDIVLTPEQLEELERRRARLDRDGPRGTPPPSPPASVEERRLVTALFCDLVGFTPLAERLDPEEIRDVQAEYFGKMAEQIERYGGTVEKYAGDAVLALFGAPIAHEDDAERAVLCALGMQEAIEPVASGARVRWGVEPSLRVGVNTGEVVSGTWNATGRQDVAVTGDAVVS